MPITRILLVEPDAELSIIMKKYLARHGYSVDVRKTAQDAVSLADSSKPDMIILEIAIPKDNGIAFINEFRSYADWADVPIAIYTHVPMIDTGIREKEWKKMGVAAYLYKPTTSLKSLSVAVEQYLRSNELV